MYLVLFHILQDVISTEQSARAHKLFHGSYCTGSRIGIMGYIDNLRQNQKLRGVPNSPHEEWRRYFQCFKMISLNQKGAIICSFSVFMETLEIYTYKTMDD